MSWSFNCLKVNEPRFVLVGYGVRLEGRVREGRMDGPLYRGLLALEQPANRDWIKDPWRVTVPRRFAAEDNTGANRKAMVLLCSTGATATIVFDQPIPAELTRDLRSIFRDDNRGPGPEDTPPEEKTDEGNQPRRKPSAKDQKGRRPRVGSPGRKRANGGGQRVQQRHR
jgi:hypothetical protein